MASKRGPHKAPLQPLPMIDQPFERIAMDFIWPLPRTARGHRFQLVIMDYATRYLEAFPLRGMQVSGVVRALIQLFSRVGVPKKILTDKGTSFTSRLMHQLCKLLQIKQLFTTVYHPQTDELIERMNQTLKDLLRKAPEAFPHQWDRVLEPLLFALRVLNRPLSLQFTLWLETPQLAAEPTRRMDTVRSYSRL